MITLSVLGPVMCSDGHQLIDLGGWRQRAVLARLLVARGQVVSADRLIDDLWGDEPPAKALLSLQTYVSRLRRILEPVRPARAPNSVLVTVPPGYRLSLHRDQVDAWRFEQMVLQADRAGDTFPEQIRRTLADALALWRGPAYADFLSEPWAAAEIARLDELRWAAQERRAAASLALGLTAEAVPELEAILTETPLRETAWQLLVLGLYRAGRQGDALAAVRRARKVLSSELGVDPGPGLRALEADVLAQSPALEGRLSAALKPPPSQDTLPLTAADHLPETDPFVGREAELERLLSSAALAQRGSACLALVEGHAGTGKTRLVLELADRLRARGWRSALGRCAAEEGAPAGFPWMAVIDELSHQREPDFGRSAHPAPDVPAAGTAVHADPFLERFRLHRRIAAQLRDAAAAGPVLVMLDDIHSADSETLSILDRVVLDLKKEPLLFVCTLQPGDRSKAASNTARRLAPSIRTRIELGGLGVDDVAELLRNTSSRQLSEEDVAAVVHRTGGNVFFVRQIGSLLGSLEAGTSLAKVPAGVRDVVRHRLAALPETSRSLLATMALIGAESDVDVLEFLDQAGEPMLFDAVEAALMAGLLEEPKPGRVGFAHGIVREAIDADISRIRRSRLHARIAAAIRTVHPADFSAIAHHYARAGTVSAMVDAADYSRRAAEQTEARFAFREAAALWRQALDCVDLLPDHDARDRLEIVMRLVRATALGGEAAAARAIRDDALARATELADVELTARVITCYDVPSLWVNQEYGVIAGQVVELIEQTLSALPARTSALRCQLLTCLALELEWSGLDRGRDAAAAAVGMARELDDPQLLAMAIAALFRQSYLPGQLPLRESLAAELLELSTEHNILTATVIAHLMMTECACARGTLGVADSHHAETMRLSEKYQLPSPAAVSSWYEGFRCLTHGRFAEADEAYRFAARLSERVRLWEVDQAWVAGTAISLAMLQERMDSILELAESCFVRWPVMGREVYVQSLLAAGRAEEAKKLAEELPPVPLEASYLLTVTWRAITGLRLGDHARIDWAYREFQPYLDEVAGGDTAVVAHGPVAQLAGDLAVRLGLKEEARGHYVHALAVAHRAESDYWASAALSALEEPGAPA